MFLAITVAVGTMLVAVVGVLYAVSRHRERVRGKLMIEASVALRAAKSLDRSEVPLERRRAGVKANRVLFLKEKHGLSLRDIDTSESELRGIIARACRKMPAGESPLPMKYIDSGLPEQDLNGYSGKLEAEIIPVGEPILFSDAEEAPAEPNLPVEVFIPADKVERFCGITAKERAIKERAAKELGAALADASCEEVTQSMDEAFAGLG